MCFSSFFLSVVRIIQFCRKSISSRRQKKKINQKIPRIKSHSPTDEKGEKNLSPITSAKKDSLVCSSRDSGLKKPADVWLDVKEELPVLSRHLKSGDKAYVKMGKCLDVWRQRWDGTSKWKPYMFSAEFLVSKN